MANAPPPACVLQLPQQLLRLLLWPAYVCRLVPPVRAAPSVPSASASVPSASASVPAAAAAASAARAAIVVVVVAVEDSE